MDVARPNTATAVDATVRLAADARFELGPRLYPKTQVERGVGIRMRDGVMLSADILRPADSHGEPTGTPLPAVVTLTPYNKAAMTRLRTIVRLAEATGRRLVDTDGSTRQTFRALLGTLSGGAFGTALASDQLIGRGYVQVVVDVRGTGSSTGRWQSLGQTEQHDALEVLEWVRRQPWCNGDLALSGMSYMAITSLQAAGHRPAGLKAVFSIVGTEDIGTDLVLTGGSQSAFIDFWLAAVNALKWVPSLPALARNRVIARFVLDRWSAPFVHLSPPGERDLNTANSRARRPQIEQIAVPTFIYGCWHDLFSRSSPGLFERLRLPAGQRQLVIDNGYHATPGVGFGSTGYPMRFDELQIAFFDRWVKGISNGIDAYGPVTVHQQGGAWTTRDRFPHPHTAPQIWYLSPRGSGTAVHAGFDGSLATNPDSESDKHCRIELPRRRPSVASQTTSIATIGLTTAFGPSWSYDDRRYERAAATFTSDRFEHDVVISGPMNLHLNVVTDGTDAFWAVTVCDVAPDGTSTVITRGALLSSRRALDETASTYVNGELVRAQHPLTADSLLPAEPGIPHQIDIDIAATEAVIKVDHRLRIAVTKGSWPHYYLVSAARRRLSAQAIAIDAGQCSLTALTVRPTPPPI